jgi:hypothetical protein
MAVPEERQWQKQPSIQRLRILANSWGVTSEQSWLFLHFSVDKEARGCILEGHHRPSKG